MHDKNANKGQVLAQTGAYRPDIDGLRAAAVLAVIAYHAFPSWLRGGFVGVDVFFVISGYLISGHIFASLERKSFSIIDFYIRRISRIFPALVTVLAACLIFGWAALLVDEFLQLGLHVAAGAGFASNLLLWQESGYFDNTAATKPLLHLWSLGVEEQFYVVWPIVAWALWRLRVASLLTIVVLAALSFALNTTYFQIDPTLDFYSPLTRFWELLAGAALAHRERSGPAFQTRLTTNAASLAGGALLALSLLTIQEGKNFPGWWALMPVVGTALIIASGPNAWANKVIGIKPMIAIGLISYPLYLWHWPLLSFAQIVQGETPSRDLRIELVLATFALAIATYFLIERPLRFGGHRRTKVLVLIGAMVAVGLSGYWVWKNEGMPSRPTIRELSEANAQFSNAIWKYSNNDTCLNRYPFKASASYTYWFCMTNRDAPPTLLLLGNSFANHHYPGFAATFPQETVLSIGTCPPMMVPFSDKAPDGPSPCDGSRWYNQQEFIKKTIQQNGSIKLVIMDGIDPVATDQGIARVQQWVDFLESNGIRVVIFKPHAKPDGDIKGCLSRPFKSPQKSCDIAPETLQKSAESFAPLVTALNLSNPDVRFFDQNQVFCTSGECSFVVDGKPMTRDQYGHYSEFASTRVAAMFAAWAQSNGTFAKQ